MLVAGGVVAEGTAGSDEGALLGLAGSVGEAAGGHAGGAEGASDGNHGDGVDGRSGDELEMNWSFNGWGVACFCSIQGL
jgi:hypothetical protein